MTSRRQFLGTTSVLAGSVLLGGTAHVFAASNTGGAASMSKRAVLSSGELIPVIGMGTSGSFQVPIGSAHWGRCTRRSRAAPGSPSTRSQAIIEYKERGNQGIDTEIDAVIKTTEIFSASPGDNILEGELLHRRVCTWG